MGEDSRAGALVPGRAPAPGLLENVQPWVALPQSCDRWPHIPASPPWDGLHLLHSHMYPQRRCRRGHGPRPAHSQQCLLNDSRQVHTHLAHTHTPCTHTHSIHSRVPLRCTATLLPRQNPAGSGELSAASPGPSAALSAPLFLSPQWGRGRVCQQRGQFPAGILCPQQLPKAREGWATSSQAPGSGLLGSPGRNHS